MPVIARTLLAFERCGEINEIVIAARADEIPMYETLRKSYNINKLTAVVEGGDTRQESVLAGLRGYRTRLSSSRYTTARDAL